METKKISDNEMEITKIPTVEPIKTIYERSFIENQIKIIAEDRDKYVASRDAEIKECQDILLEMDKLNIGSGLSLLKTTNVVDNI